VRAIQLVRPTPARDPRDYALVPFGGAGPLHAARIAEELGISTIVVPPTPGVILGLRLVASDYTEFDAVTRKIETRRSRLPRKRQDFGEMRARLAAQFADMKLPGDLVYTHMLEMRFVGQASRSRGDCRRQARLARRAYLSELFADAHHRTSCMAPRPTVHRDRERCGSARPCPSGRTQTRPRETRRPPRPTRPDFPWRGLADCPRHTAEALTTGQKITGPR